MIIRTINATSNKFKMVVVTVLGIAQDGGRPQPSCYKSCCSNLTLSDVRYPVALGVVNGTTIHLFETSRYLGEQLRFLWKLPASNISENIDHVWITHAHWGHIDGLGLFGRETMNCKGVRLHVSESMASLIRRTPSWNAMVEQGVFIMDIFPNSAHKKAVFRRCTSIRHFLKSFRIDIALIDGTFWSYDELGNIRDQSQVPHPPISETINLLGTRKPEQDPLIYFTHLNHTNPLYDTSSVQYKTLFEMGWDVAHQGMTFAL